MPSPIVFSEGTYCSKDCRVHSFQNVVKQLNKANAEKLQKTIDASSEDGWTVLVDLTDKLNRTNHEIEEKELRWLEVAEELEGVEMEVQT